MVKTHSQTFEVWNHTGGWGNSSKSSPLEPCIDSDVYELLALFRDPAHANRWKDYMFRR